MATPEQIAAAWGAWRVRHKGSMGPGPGFVEAINAALAVPTTVAERALTMEDIHREQLARPRIKPSEAEGRTE